MNGTQGLLLLQCGLVATGCAVHLEKPVPLSHVVMVDRSGAPIDPTGNVRCRKTADPANPGGRLADLCMGDHARTLSYARLNGDEYDAYLDHLFEDLDCFREKREGKTRILLYAHGGLNTQIRSIDRAIHDAPEIRSAGTFPIFLNWQSNLVSSYFSQVYSVRKGKHYDSFHPAAWGLTPFYVGQDVTRAATRAVPVWSFMFANDARSLSKENAVEKTVAEVSAARELAKLQRIDLERGEDSRKRGEMWLHLAKYALTVPSKVLSSPFLDAAGTPAWRGMLRASETPFRTDELTQNLARDAGGPALLPFLESEHLSTNGGYDVFLARLKKYISIHGGKDQFEVVLVGHSMGAIIENHILRLAEGSGDGLPGLPISHIVYMAAAASIHDYEDSVFPYLRHHPETQMHHLVLHVMADVRDHVAFDVPPRGSLLVWIDNFLNERRTYRDRTAGRMDSLVRSLDDLDGWEDIVPQIHIREFSAGKVHADREPQHHGDFGRISYWDERCWETGRKYERGDCYDRHRCDSANTSCSGHGNP